MLAAPPDAWVIGGAGFLGSAVAGLWRAAGGRVLALDPAAGAEGIAGRAGEAAVVQRALACLSPGVIFFCASTRGGDAGEYRRAYSEPVQAAAAAAPGARLVFCSSCAVYEQGGVATEQSATPGATPRLSTLLAAERAVCRAGGVVARLAALYGPGRCELLRRHCAGEPRLPGPPDRVLNYVHVHDAARALALLATAPSLPHSVYNVCAESFTVAQAYAALESITGRVASASAAAAGRRGSADHRVCAELLRTELGWQPRVTFADFCRGEMQVTQG